MSEGSISVPLITTAALSLEPLDEPLPREHELTLARERARLGMVQNQGSSELGRVQAAGLSDGKIVSRHAESYRETS